MTQTLRIALAQARNEEEFDGGGFERHLRELVAANPNFHMWVFPEFHLEPRAAHGRLQAAARALDDAAILRLGEVARELGIWLIPGSFYERGEDGRVYNTTVVFSPEGQLVSSYRKIFPWRPTETGAPGSSFQVFDIPGIGRVGLSICYDMWFPEHARHLAWMGADLIVNIVQTGTSDREQELAIVRGNAIMNQVWIASVNAAAPSGLGRSLIVDPQGARIVASPGPSEEILTAVLDLGAARRVQQEGTAGVSRPWNFFNAGDAALPLPLYEGRMTPETWAPRR